MTTDYCNGKRAYYATLFDLDFDDLMDSEVEWIENNYNFEYTEKYVFEEVVKMVENGIDFIEALDNAMLHTVWMFDVPEFYFDATLEFYSASGDVAFNIAPRGDKFIASNTFGAGEWLCDTIEDAIKAVGMAFNDKIIRMTK